jgi:uncharacterized protein
MDRRLAPVIAALSIGAMACSKGGSTALPPSGIHPCEPARCEQLCRSEPAACERAAELYFWGTNGLPLDPVKSLALAKRACDAGRGHGCTLLGFHHQDGRGTAWNPQEAERVYERACQLGAGTGCYNLAGMYSGGHGVTVDSARYETYQQKAVVAWQAACDGRERRWCTNAAFALPDPDAEATRKRRLELNTRACDAGVETGCVQVALDQEKLGIATDAEVLAELERRCASDGGACVIAAARLFTGTQAPRDPRRAVALVQRGCERGDAEACESIGTETFLGEYLPRDRSAAIRYFAMACDRGLARACAKLSAIHREDNRPEMELELARRACEMNDAGGCVIVGAMYDGGIGVPRSEVDALRWFTEACRRAEADGCSYLPPRGVELPLPDDLRRPMYQRLCQGGLSAACEHAGG